MQPSASHQVQINKSVTVGGDSKLLIIAGPCQIESEAHCNKIAEELLRITSKHPVSLLFKSSYDKANRTSLAGKRGVGIEAGLKILAGIKARFGVPVITDVHSVEDAERAAEYVDVLQIPAFLCRQTDLLIAAGKTGKTINLKKGQFLHPGDMQFCAEKIASTGNKNILLCERGSCFGYRELIVDMRGLSIMRENGYPVVFDATHSAQLMGGGGGKSGGSRVHVPLLARAAAAAGIDGLFVECHDNPDIAPSDGETMLNLTQMDLLLREVCAVRQALSAVS